MMPFAYYMLLLTYDAFIQRRIEKRWINPIVIVRSIRPFLYTIYGLLLIRFGSLGICQSITFCRYARYCCRQS